jgi:hypothetical protein
VISERSFEAKMRALYLADSRPQKQLAQVRENNSERENASKWTRQELVTQHIFVNREFQSTK